MLETAIIGAGPYGLAIAAHFRRHGLPFRIFGRPMDSWLNHMPKGMMLKSDGFASNIYDPDEEFTLGKFCAERGIEYADSGIPVRLDTFSAYGLAFRDRMLPELEDKLVIGLERAPEGFLLRLDSGETVTARRVVVAVGITHFEYIPENLAHLPSELLSHSFRHSEPERFTGRNVVVIGGGASAIDLAAVLHEAGADVQLVARQSSLKCHSTPTGKPRSWWRQIRHPQSGLGPGLRSRFFSDTTWLFHYLPERFRVVPVERTLGPSARFVCNCAQPMARSATFSPSMLLRRLATKWIWYDCLSSVLKSARRSKSSRARRCCRPLSNHRCPTFILRGWRRQTASGR